MPGIWRFRSLTALLVAVAASAWVPALADGFNDWPGELVEPGEVDLVPSIQGARLPVLSSYSQLQLEIGLSPGTELSVIAAVGHEGTTIAGDGLYVQPRVALGPLLSATLGVYVPFGDDGSGLGVIAGVVDSVKFGKGRYKLNLNVFLTADSASIGEVMPQIYAVAMLQRQLTDVVAVYVEADLTRPQGGGAMLVEAFAGVQLDINDDNAVNVAAMVPTRPTFEPRELMLGVWFSRRVVPGGWLK